MIVREPGAASESACLAFLREHQRPSTVVLAHVRKATQGARVLRNTQPFTRELGGRPHVFAHNGTLRGIEGDHRFATQRFLPIGETDSEQAFCALLERIAALGDGTRALPSLDRRLEVVAAFAAEARTLGRRTSSTATARSSSRTAIAARTPPAWSPRRGCTCSAARVSNTPTSRPSSSGCRCRVSTSRRSHSSRAFR